MKGYLETWLLLHPQAQAQDTDLITIALNNADQRHKLVEQLLELVLADIGQLE